MKSAVVRFPGINRERDMMMALEAGTGIAPVSIWHTETELPDVDLIVIPGGFSYGDYLRCGAIAGRSPVMAELLPVRPGFDDSIQDQDFGTVLITVTMAVSMRSARIVCDS